MNPNIKRLLKEAKELANPTFFYYAHPLEDNIFEWHFTIRGTKETEFEGGRYHGRIILPPEYPMKPPSVIMLTPSGRFEINKKICLSLSDYHPEEWLPVWGIRTILLAMIGFLPSDSLGSIASLNYSKEVRKELAKKSLDFICTDCGDCVKTILKETHAEENNLFDETNKLLSVLTLKDEIGIISTTTPVDVNINPTNKSNIDKHRDTDFTGDNLSILKSHDVIRTEKILNSNCYDVIMASNLTSTNLNKEDNQQINKIHNVFYDLNSIDQQNLLLYQISYSMNYSILLTLNLISKKNNEYMKNKITNMKNIRDLYSYNHATMYNVLLLVVVAFFIMLILDLQIFLS